MIGCGKAQSARSCVRAFLPSGTGFITAPTGSKQSIAIPRQNPSGVEPCGDGPQCSSLRVHGVVAFDLKADCGNLHMRSVHPEPSTAIAALSPTPTFNCSMDQRRVS